MSATLNLGNGDWATKENSLLGYNSENGNYKPLPFDFTRASNGTFVNKSGLIETAANGVPRIDFLGNTSGALKLEPQRTNLVTYSSDFSNAVWAKNGALIATANASTSPSGETDSTLLYNTGNENRISQNISVVSGNSYTMSVYLRNNGGNNTITFEAIGYSSQSITINNDWARYDYTITATSTASVQFRFLSFDNNINLYAWGAQVEQGSYATSLINTQGSAVTRVQDACSQTPPSGIIGQTEGTVYWEIDVQTTVATANENILNIDNGNGFGSTIYLSKSATGNLIAEMYLSSSLQASFTKTNITKGIHKMAMAYANNNTAFFVDGIQVGITDTSCTVPLMSRIQLGNGVFGQMIGLSNDLKLYNTRLSNAELAALTS